MRGQRVRIPPRKTKLDLLIVAARYEDGWLQLAKGYQVYGQVWSDVLLYTREQLIELLQAGARVGYGRHAPLAADFNVEGRLSLAAVEDQVRIVGGQDPGAGDSLGVPIF